MRIRACCDCVAAAADGDAVPGDDVAGAAAIVGAGVPGSRSWVKVCAGEAGGCVDWWGAGSSLAIRILWSFPDFIQTLFCANSCGNLKQSSLAVILGSVQYSRLSWLTCAGAFSGVQHPAKPIWLARTHLCLRALGDFDCEAIQRKRFWIDGGPAFSWRHGE
jgi:hypothetical protein